ncbi:hypothetical protein QO004_000096 [Rhizobium mesoamericanum]|uniref:hypothetical protein n=1 Tax=Rhizobium mesoamericanum TaxID=1079800 RepID=UPI00278906D5|nr:hypothetical protein [Rhizobium mesoamericanum]MDQ0558323.1 hypothetical protein [Rhizobium mesoamericanum]
MKYSAANDNQPRMAFRGQWVGEEFFPESSQARVDKAEVKAKARVEEKAINKHRRRLAKRNKPSDGWDGKAANDNPSLPIIKALLAEGNNDLLPALLFYRRVEDAATSDAQLVGNSVGNEPLQAEQDLWLDEKTGAIQRKGMKQSKSKDAQPWRAKSIDVFKWTYTKQLPAQVPTKWNGDDKVIARIDGINRLAEMRASLGPLVEPFEEAALHGATLEKVGMMAGATSSRSAMAVGRAVVHMALSVIRDRAGPITYSDLKEIAA